MKQNDFSLYISFGKSKSPRYQEALRQLSVLPHNSNLEQNGSSNECTINNLYAFEVYTRTIRKLMAVIGDWKSTQIKLNNQVLSLKDYYKFERDYYTHDHVDKFIAIEDLPYPIVYYPEPSGTFLAFRKDLESDIVFCSCAESLIKNYMRLYSIMELNKNYIALSAAPLSAKFFPSTIAKLSLNDFKIKYVNHLCHRCNSKTPSLTYCHEMYGSKFMQKYGWYKNQTFLRFGIDPGNISQYLEDICPPEFKYPVLKSKLDFQGLSSNNGNNQHEHLTKQLNKQIENITRQEFGVKKIGEGWISETILYNIVSAIFPNDKILRHYRPDWLNKLELDIFIPDKKIAFEYQGQQHFVSVEHWGGDKALAKTQKHDLIKAETCNNLGVQLIHINYYDPLTEEFVKNQLYARNLYPTRH